MNEKIKLLAEQALDYAQKNQSADIPQHWFKLYNEKFAELIVRECGKVIEDHFEPVYDGKLLKQHFGVEE